MKTVLKATALATLLAFGASAAIAQTPPAKSKTEAGAPDQGPAAKSTPGTGSPAAPAAKSKSEAGAPDQGPAVKEGVGSRPMGPPATQTPGKAPNPTGVSEEKQKSEGNDPRTGGVPK
jgi:hypothetical protein